MVPSMKVDLCVIGGGLSGAVAALHAAERGKQVVLIRRGWGGTALSSGAFDLADSGDLSSPGLTGEFEISYHLERIKKTNPHHPYHFLNFDHLSPSLELLKKAVSFKILGSYHENHLFLSQMGHWLRRAFAMESQFFDFKAAGRSKVLVLGFSPILPARGEAEGSPLYTSESIPWYRDEVNTLPSMMAKILDQPDELRKLARHIKAHIKSHFFSALLVPPVIGLDAFQQRRSELESLIGCPVYETAGAENSVPGVRFQKGLDRALSSQRVSVIDGKVEKVISEKKRILAVEVGQKEIEAFSFVLATGKFLAGGIRKKRGFQETVFGLPLFYKVSPVSKIDQKLLLRPDFFERQPIFEVGVKTDRGLFPVDDRGERVYENLRACGTVLYGFDPYGDESRFGVSMLSGYQAGGEA